MRSLSPHCWCALLGASCWYQQVLKSSTQNPIRYSLWICFSLYICFISSSRQSSFLRFTNTGWEMTIYFFFVFTCFLFTAAARLNQKLMVPSPNSLKRKFGWFGLGQVSGANLTNLSKWSGVMWSQHRCWEWSPVGLNGAGSLAYEFSRSPFRGNHILRYPLHQSNLSKPYFSSLV